MSSDFPRFLVAAVLALAVVLTGCGGSNKKGSGYSYAPGPVQTRMAV